MPPLLENNLGEQSALVTKMSIKAWKLWDTLKITTLVLVSAVLVVVAFRNSVTWHLQKFLEASGIFWQTQWENLHHMLGGNELVIFVLGAGVVPFIAFFFVNGIFMVADVTGKPSFITRYRMQLGKNDPVDREKLCRAIPTILFNICISIPMGIFLWVFLQRAEPCSLQLPTFRRFLAEMTILILLEETLFYYSHRLFHHPLLYKHIHKKHHEWTAPVGIISIYAHPVEHLVSNVMPAIVGPILLQSHITTISAWLSLVLVSTTVSHCGYHLPLLPSPEFHDFHHLKFNQCYGVLGILDRLHGTDTIFRQTKAYERHCILLGLTPLSESIPDSPKKLE